MVCHGSAIKHHCPANIPAFVIYYRGSASLHTIVTQQCHTICLFLISTVKSRTSTTKPQVCEGLITDSKEIMIRQQITGLSCLEGIRQGGTGGREANLSLLWLWRCGCAQLSLRPFC